MMLLLDRRVRVGVASAPCPPLSPDGAGVDGDRLAGPDHELGAVRGLQPAALALARRLAAGEAVAHRRALHRDRIRDLLLHRPLRRVQLDPAPSPGARGRRLVRLAPPARQPGAAALRRRIRHGRVPGDLPRPHGAVHLLAGDPVGLGLRRDHLPVSADLGVRARHHGDDSRRHPLLPRRHGTHASREAGPALALVPHPPGARNVPGHGRHLERRILRVWRRIRRDPRFGPRDGRRLSLSVSRSQGLRPAGLLRARGCSPAPTSRATGTPG